MLFDDGSATADGGHEIAALGTTDGGGTHGPRLTAAADPARPVRVFVVALDTDVNLTTLNQITAVTGGAGVHFSDMGRWRRRFWGVRPLLRLLRTRGALRRGAEGVTEPALDRKHAVHGNPLRCADS